MLRAWTRGDERAADRVIPLVYAELHRLAERYLHGERERHTLQPTALVHEAYLRLVDLHRIAWQDRRHFFAVACRVMRRILVDHARHYRYAKRGGGLRPVSLEEVVEPGVERRADLLAIDDALRDLAAVDPAKAELVELRFFGGLSVEMTAELLGSSRATVIRQWRMAKAWLHRELGPGDSG